MYEVSRPERAPDYTYTIADEEIYSEPAMSEEDYLRRTERETETRRDRFELIEVLQTYDVHGWDVNVWILPRGKETKCSE